MTSHQHGQGPALGRSDDARQAVDPRGVQTLSHWGHSVLGTHGHRGEPVGESRSHPPEDQPRPATPPG